MATFRRKKILTIRSNHDGFDVFKSPSYHSPVTERDQSVQSQHPPDFRYVRAT